jgi:bifunctional N-acetylglucosamine-1-phosphate-uridyltransferase/glucosamine-1-phosphate-acetyltransferase GlmU-like protein
MINGLTTKIKNKMNLYQEIQEHLHQLLKQNVQPDVLLMGTEQERQLFTDGSIPKADDVQDHFKQEVIILSGDKPFKLLKEV